MIIVLNRFLNILNNKFFLSFVIVLSSFFFTYYSGLRGIYPLDSFIIFDGGFKILNGVYPFKDYWSISGPFVDYFQSLIFFIFKINWFSYVLHAALINSFLALLSFYFFYTIGIKIFLSFLYALGISILAYPSSGTPFMDHHAVIFSLASLIVLILGFKENNNLFWFLIPIFLGLAFFSKQVPASFFGILYLVLIFLYFKLNNFKNLKKLIYLFYGKIFLLSIVLILILLQNIPFKNIFIQYFLYPMSIGETRSYSLDLDINNFLLQFKFIYIALFPLLFFGLTLIFSKNKSFKKKIDILIFYTVISTIFIFIFTQLLTKNQVLIFFLIPFALAMSNYFCNLSGKKKVFDYFLVAVLIITTYKYHLRFNVDKKFMELSNVNIGLSVPAQNLNSKLSGLNWISPIYPNNPNLEINLLKDSIENITLEKKNKIIMSNYQILPFLTETRSFAPNKWFDGLSVPDKDNLYFQNYKDFFLKKLEEQKIEIIFIVGKQKKKYLKNIFKDPECYSEQNINTITIKLNINNCLK